MHISIHYIEYNNMNSNIKSKYKLKLKFHWNIYSIYALDYNENLKIRKGRNCGKVGR